MIEDKSRQERPTYRVNPLYSDAQKTMLMAQQFKNGTPDAIEVERVAKAIGAARTIQDMERQGVKIDDIWKALDRSKNLSTAVAHQLRFINADAGQTIDHVQDINQATQVLMEVGRLLDPVAPEVGKRETAELLLEKGIFKPSTDVTEQNEDLPS